MTSIPPNVYSTTRPSFVLFYFCAYMHAHIVADTTARHTRASISTRDNAYTHLNLSFSVYQRKKGLRMARWCIRLMRLTLACEVIRCHWFKSDKILKKKKKTSGWRAAIAFLYLFLFHSLLRHTSLLSQE